MSKATTRSAGIRMPSELYDWVDEMAAKHKLTRSECVCRLIRQAQRPTKDRKAPLPNGNGVWFGVCLSTGVITLSLEGIIRLIANT